jgi:predicted nicotinamide N-methyase
VQTQARLPRPFDHALALRRPPLCPELALWLIGIDVDLEAECHEMQGGASPPYWAFCWGSGQALARWLLDHPEEVRERVVVDFGAGSGVAGIAAGLTGASHVVAVDLDPDARIAAAANARENGLSPQQFESAAEVPAEWDLLLASDVLYERGLHPLIEELRETAVAAGAGLLAGEPERPGNPGHAGAPLRRYEVKTFPDVDSPTTHASVYRLAPNPVRADLSG